MQGDTILTFDAVYQIIQRAAMHDGLRLLEKDRYASYLPYNWWAAWEGGSRFEIGATQEEISNELAVLKA